MNVNIEIDQKTIVEALKEKVMRELSAGLDIERISFSIKSNGMNEDPEITATAHVRVKAM